MDRITTFIHRLGTFLTEQPSPGYKRCPGCDGRRFIPAEAKLCQDCLTEVFQQYARA